jgi:N-acyl-D-aspartate/D-glutamate deacylase
MPQHGVTTVLIGNCSLSLAPLRPEQRDGLSAVFAYVEDMPPSVFAEAVPWSWTTFPEYLEVLRALPCTVNVATLVGHTPLRMFVMGDDAWDRAATPDERGAMAEVLDEALGAGALGLSTSWFDEDAHKRPTPSVLADDAELGELLTSRRPGRRSSSSSTSRRAWRDDVTGGASPDRGLVSTFNGLLRQRTSRPDPRDPRPHRRAPDRRRPGVPAGLAARRRCPRELVRRDVVLRPGDHLAPGRPGRCRREATDAHRPRVATAGPRRMGRDEAHHVPHPFPNVRLVGVHGPPWHPGSVGPCWPTVADQGGHPSDVLADWLLANDLEPGVVGVDVTNADIEGRGRDARHLAAIISEQRRRRTSQMMMRREAVTPRSCSRHVRERGDFTLEDAVWQLTGRQAAIFGMPDHGVLRPGAIADVTVFALDELHWDKEEFVTDLPGAGPRFRRPAGGYRYTVVHGRVTQEHGTLTGSRPGRPVERS